MTDTLPSSVDGVDNTRSVSQGRLILRRFLRGKTGLISLIVLVATVVFATSAIGIGPIPGWWKWNYYDPSAIVDGGNPTLQLWPFSLGDHPFGQDRIGRDYFAMTMRGIQNSFVVMILITGIAVVLGVVVGAIAGYYRGWVDSVLMRITDVFIVIPRS